MKSGACMDLRLSFPHPNVNHNTQLSAGQCAVFVIFSCSLVIANAISLSMFFLRTVAMFRMSTGSLLIARIVSPDNNPICCPNKFPATFSIFAGVETRFPLINHSFCKKVIVGIR